jgi:hypothetical protein
MVKNNNAPFLVEVYLMSDTHPKRAINFVFLGSDKVFGE